MRATVLQAARQVTFEQVPDPQVVLPGDAVVRVSASCVRGSKGPDGHLVDGGQGEFVRVPLADGTLVATPEQPNPDMIPSLLTLTDVMGTGWHAASSARVHPLHTVVVVGDGAVGLCGVLAASRMGADAVLECVGTTESMQTAFEIPRPGTTIGFVGVPHDVELPIGQMFRRDLKVMLTNGHPEAG